MIKKIITYLTPKKYKQMAKHNDKKNEITPEVKNEITPELSEAISELTKDKEITPEVKNEIEGETINEIIEDPEKFSNDMMNAFINSTENLRIIKKQFNFDSQHFVTTNIIENERLLNIIEKMKNKI